MIDDEDEIPLQPLSPLGVARARRKLSVEEAAARAGLAPDVVLALEENRLYRFPSVRDAVAATLVYATALGISRREARQLAGLPDRARVLDLLSVRRFVAAVALLCALGALAWLALEPRLGQEIATPAPAADTAGEIDAAALPEAWEIRVDVLNGSPRAGAATAVANRIAALAYTIGDVKDAPRQDYPDTRVYFPPGAEDVAARLAKQLPASTQALPGGKNPRRLVVIVGRRAPPG